MLRESLPRALVFAEQADVVFGYGAFENIRPYTEVTPLLLNNDLASPVGVVVSTKEDSILGLHVTGQLFLELRDARTAAVLLKHKQLSGATLLFEPGERAYDARGARRVTKVSTLAAIGLAPFAPRTPAGKAVSVRDTDATAALILSELRIARKILQWQ